MSCDKNNRLSRLFVCLYAYNVVAITILLTNTNTTEKRIKNSLNFPLQMGQNDRHWSGHKCDLHRPRSPVYLSVLVQKRHSTISGPTV